MNKDVTLNFFFVLPLRYSEPCNQVFVHFNGAKNGVYSQLSKYSGELVIAIRYCYINLDFIRYYKIVLFWPGNDYRKIKYKVCSMLYLVVLCTNAILNEQCCDNVKNTRNWLALLLSSRLDKLITNYNMRFEILLDTL